MIIYGTKASHLKTNPINGVCTNCQTENAMILSAYQKYAHVFWIPFFPTNKIFLSQCNNCKQVLEEKQIKTTYRTAYDDLRHTLRTPIWTFVGLGLLGVVILFSMYSNNKKAELSKGYLEAPKAGDVYEYKTDAGQYSLMKVMSVSADTVFFVHNKYESNKISGLSKLENQGDTTFSDELFMIQKKELLEMQTKNEILEVIRK